MRDEAEGEVVRRSWLRGGPDKANVPPSPQKAAQQRMELGLKQAFGLDMQDLIDYIWLVSIRLVINVQDAEDVTQNAIEKLIKWSMRHQVPPSNARAYVFKAARNAAVDFLKAKKETAGYELIDELTLALEDSPEDLLLRNVIKEAWNSAMSELPDTHARAIRLTVIDGLSKAEAARKEGIAESTFRSRLKAAIVDLRVYMRRRGW